MPWWCGWDTLDTPNWRALGLDGYQGGRSSMTEIVEQLSMLPGVRGGLRPASAKGASFEADDFTRHRRGGRGEARRSTVLVAAGTATRSSWYPGKDDDPAPDQKAARFCVSTSPGARALGGVRAVAGAGFHPHCVVIRRTRTPGARGIGAG